MKLLTIVALVALFPSAAFATHPDCSGWPTNMAFVHLKNANITDNYKLDFGKTKSVRLASEQIGKDRYRQVHHVTFTENSGNTIEVVTVNDASNEECSMGPVDVLVVKQKIGGR